MIGDVSRMLKSVLFQYSNRMPASQNRLRSIFSALGMV